MSLNSTLHKLVFFVPATHKEAVKAAVFAAGAGRIGAYSQCCWEVLGQGQFLPEVDATPFLGQPETLERVAEWRIEMVCAQTTLQAVVAALKAAHPYETPAWECWPLANAQFEAADRQD